MGKPQESSEENSGIFETFESILERARSSSPVQPNATAATYTLVEPNNGNGAGEAEQLTPTRACKLLGASVRSTIYSHFFKPYKSGCDFVGMGLLATAVGVVTGPIVGAVITAISGVASLVSAALGVTSALIGAAVYCFDPEGGSDMLFFALTTTALSLLLAAATLLFAAITLLAPVIAVTSLVTRTASTVAAKLGCWEPEPEPEQELQGCCL